MVHLHVAHFQGFHYVMLGICLHPVSKLSVGER